MPILSPNPNPIRVSIRSPHRGEGRSRSKKDCGGCLRFQSAPLTEARGDRSATRKDSRSKPFQSAPLTEARGDQAEASADADHGCVSIRSPHRGEGRYFFAHVRKTYGVFQSAPLTEARGDSRSTIARPSPSGFNPLPSPRRGEIHRHPRAGRWHRSFNPLPSPRRGEMSRKQVP